MVVMKFGGTSVGSADAIRQVGDIVTGAASTPVVVVSAVSGVTNLLLEVAEKARRRESAARSLVEPLRARHKEILAGLKLSRKLVDADLDLLQEALHGIYLLRELTARSRDFVVSFGELMSARIVAAHLERRGAAARAWPAWDAGMLTDENHGEAEVLPESYRRLAAKLKPALRSEIPVVTGFLGRSRTGERTTLGRGGSDFTAAIIGRALEVEEIQIWTDVTGIMSCDPRVVPQAYTVRGLSFAEAAELAYFGAKVLHPKTVEPAVEAGIPVRIVNTFAPEDPGSLVTASPGEDGGPAVRGLAVKRGNVLVSLTSTRMLDAEGYLARVFGDLAERDVSVDCLATSEVSVTMTVDARYEQALKPALKALRRYARTSVARGRAIICVVGAGMQVHPGVAGDVFGVIGREGINVELISQGASELNLTFVVKDAEADRALCALHRHFLEPGPEAAEGAT